MVATLVRLRWRLTLNALSRNVWAIIGTALGALYGLMGVVALLGFALFLSRSDAGTASLVVGVCGAVTVLCWTVVPLLLTGVDTTLDPRAMAAWVAPSRSLSRGLAVASACGVTGVLTGAGCLLPVLVWARSGQAGAALLALVLAPVLLATCVLLSRVVVIGLGVSQSRRGRELAGVLGVAVVLVAVMAPTFVSSLSLSDSEALTRTASAAARVVGLTPLGWAASAPGYLAQGQGALAALLTVAAVALVALLVPAWDRVAARVMTGPARSTGRARSYEDVAHRRGAGGAGGVAADGAGAGAAARPDPLAWHRRLTRLLPSPAAAVAARCLRYWRSDPRYLTQLGAIVLVPLVFTGAFLGGSWQVSDGTRVVAEAAGWGHVSPALMGVAAFSALMCGWALHDDLAYDSTALWQHVSAGLRGRDDLLGRVTAAALWQVPVVVALAGLGAAASGRWDLLPAVLGVCATLLGCAWAWSCVTCVLLPYETNAPGESPMRSRTSGTAFLAALVQLVGMTLIVLMSGPVIAALVATVVSGQHLWGWAVLVVGLAWGAGAAWGGIVLGGRHLDARGAQLLATIRSWAGHEQTA